MIVENLQDRRIRMKVEDGKLYVETTHLNDRVLDQNQKIRNEGLMRRGAEMPLHPKGAEVAYAILAPESEWTRLRAKNNDLWLRLHSNDQVIREKAAEELRAIHPEWFVHAPRKMFTGSGTLGE
jgi:hypothetical protein